jgi:hypothetical protein
VGRHAAAIPPTVIHAPAFGNAGHTFPAPKMKTWRTRVISRSDDPVSPILPHDIENVRDLTQLLHNARHGDPVAEERLMECIYKELHQLATRFLSGERPDHTLQPTALVNEAYLKLFGKKAAPGKIGSAREFDEVQAGVGFVNGVISVHSAVCETST